MARTKKDSKGITLSAGVAQFNSPLIPEAKSEQIIDQSLVLTVQSDGVVTAAKLVDAIAAPAVKQATLVLPAGTKESPQYLITPTMGTRPRWFEKKRLTSWQKAGDGFEITLPARAVKDRGLQDMVKTEG
jgi:hypothetical protein